MNSIQHPLTPMSLFHILQVASQPAFFSVLPILSSWGEGVFSFLPYPLKYSSHLHASLPPVMDSAHALRSASPRGEAHASFPLD